MSSELIQMNESLPIIMQCLCSQTTSVTRVGGPGGLLKVRVEIDKLGDLKLKISDLFGGRKIIGTVQNIIFVHFRF